MPVQGGEHGTCNTDHGWSDDEHLAMTSNDVFSHCGGCVRDLLCGINPKDFDIATDATPEQIRKIFRASRIIGKRFKLVHVFNRSELIEVATFRSGNNGFNDGNLVTDQSGKIIRDNVWGTLEEDTYRRDFTINALYYCPITGKIEDHNKGLKHIHNKEIVSIGDPDLRFEEDPVRGLRAIRFCTKLNFKINNNIKEAIYKKGHLLSSVSNAGKRWSCKSLSSTNYLFPSIYFHFLILLLEHGHEHLMF